MQTSIIKTLSDDFHIYGTSLFGVGPRTALQTLLMMKSLSHIAIKSPFFLDEKYLFEFLSNFYKISDSLCYNGFKEDVTNNSSNEIFQAIRIIEEIDQNFPSKINFNKQSIIEESIVLWNNFNPGKLGGRSTPHQLSRLFDLIITHAIRDSELIFMPKVQARKGLEETLLNLSGARLNGLLEFTPREEFIPERSNVETNKCQNDFYRYLCNSNPEMLSRSLEKLENLCNLAIKQNIENRPYKAFLLKARIEKTLGRYSSFLQSISYAQETLSYRMQNPKFDREAESIYFGDALLLLYFKGVEIDAKSDSDLLHNAKRKYENYFRMMDQKIEDVTKQGKEVKRNQILNLYRTFISEREKRIREFGYFFSQVILDSIGIEPRFHKRISEYNFI